MTRIPTVIAMLSLFSTSQASAWSSQAHEAIAEVAQAQPSPAATAALAQILQNATPVLAPGALAGVATWPDELRAGAVYGTIAATWSPADTHEADTFNADHKTNASWHFVNLPLGAAAYPPTDPPNGDPMRAFVGPDDIVHALVQCIAILEAPTPPPDFSKRQAVRWLVHLVGDLHQPLHVTTGYYNTALSTFATKPKRIDDPSQAAAGGILGDRGANGLLFSASTANNLHAVWDKCLPGLVAGATCSNPGSEYTPLAHVITDRLTSAPPTPTPGDYHAWPAAWATDALRQAVKINNHTGEESVQATITSPTKAHYTQAHVDAASAQLVKAAARLGALLNAIDWK
jgi:S1/P1 nuclease